MRLLTLGLAAALGLTLTTTAPTTATSAPTAVPAAAGATASAPSAAARAAVPSLVVRRQVTGLDHPWDLRPIGGGRLIFTQRDRATVSIWEDGSTRRVRGFPSGSVWVSGETGLLGLEVDPGFSGNHRFYTCQGATRPGGRHEVRVMRWTLNAALTTVTRSKRVLGGLPATSGRHGGCRLLAVGPRLYVGTGDAAVGRNPRNLKSLAGKTLCLLPSTGDPCRRNAFASARNQNKRLVHTFGHRNVQGLDRRRDGSLWAVEQGTFRDDEVNRLVNGADYGYNPVPGYNESVPMTDQSLPGRQRAAVWRSGDPTIATSGAGFVYGRGWGAYNGNLAVAALKAERVLFLKLSRAGKLQRVRVPAPLRRFGRIRTVVDGPGPVVYVTTDNGNGNDAILAVRPRGH
jgi:aldose sugar dehydrogenase